MSCLGAIAIILGIASSVRAVDPDQEAKPFAEQFKPLLAKHCQSCHRGDKPKGNFLIDNLSLDFADKENRLRWLSVLKQVQEGTMPPKGKPRPPADELKGLSDWIGKQLAYNSAAQGRVVL